MMVRYGTKPDSLYDRMADTLEKNENVCVVNWNIENCEEFAGCKNVEDCENVVRSGYEAKELNRDEYIDLLSLLEIFAADEYIRKSSGESRKKTEVVPPTRKVRKYVHQNRDVQSDHAQTMTPV